MTGKQFDEGKTFTPHLPRRMGQRNITADAVDLVFAFGREVNTRGATIFAIGRREIRRHAKQGVNLSHLDGVQIVCEDWTEPRTVYRNPDFRGLRRNLGRGRHNRARRPDQPRGINVSSSAVTT